MKSQAVSQARLLKAPLSVLVQPDFGTGHSAPKINGLAQASNFGQIAEQILPAFRTFPYPRSECRIMFKPIDYIVFTNLAASGKVEAIKFVDAKTGDGRLDNRQKQIRDRIQEGSIKHKVLK